MVRRVLLSLSLLVAACSDGRLLIELELPSNKELDPTVECRRAADQQLVCDSADPRLARFSLRVTQNGRQLRIQDAVIGGPEELAVGSVPVDQPFDMRLAASSSSGQILGLGEVKDLVVSGTSDTRVKIKFRKPVGYVAGGAKLIAIDTAASRTFELDPIPFDGIRQIAAAENGVLVIGASDSALYRINTGNHVAFFPQPLALQAGEPARCAAIGPDNRNAIICHDSRVTSVIDLSSDVPQQKTFQVGGKPTAVAFERDGSAAWVLVNGVTDGKCAGQQSQLVRVDIEQGPKSQQPIALGQPASDVAVDPLDGRLLVALPCQGDETGVLARIDGNAIAQRLTVPRIYDLPVTERSIIVVGEAPQTAEERNRLPHPARRVDALIIDRSDPTKPPLPAQDQLASLTRTFYLPPIGIVLGNDQSPEGFLLWASQARDARVRRVAISPDGRRALALIEATYASKMNLLSCTYDTELNGVSYLLVDLEAQTVLLSRFTQLTATQCSTSCATYKGQSMTDRAVCEQAFTDVLQSRGELAQPQFDARDVALLFGGG